MPLQINMARERRRGSTSNLQRDWNKRIDTIIMPTTYNTLWKMNKTTTCMEACHQTKDSKCTTQIQAISLHQWNKWNMSIITCNKSKWINKSITNLELSLQTNLHTRTTTNPLKSCQLLRQRHIQRGDLPKKRLLN